tara:strand:- start:151 stop:270 length:120 start_codon:yes stop_codon:yes gene_type:complete
MSIWILIGAVVAGICFIVGLGLYLTHGLDEGGEPLEYRE